MPSDNYKIFLSSGMEEFKEERGLIKKELDAFFSTFVYEQDALARSQSTRETYIEELACCDLYMGLFGKGYGKYTVDEFRSAVDYNIECHIYLQNVAENETRDEELTRFIDEISTVDKGLTICWFSDSGDLISKVKKSLKIWIKARDNTGAPSFEKTKLDISQKYFCDRVPQSMDFANYDKNEKFNFFIIDGAKKQSHISLVKRFSIDKTACDYSKPPISIEDIGNINRLKTHIRTELFRKFGVRPIPTDLSIYSLVQSIQHDGYEQVFIIFRIEEDLLSNKNITEAIRWFSNEYCDGKSLTAGSPDFYFFLVIRYNETGTSKKKYIQRLLANFKGYIKLDELDNVGFKHLRQWVEDNGITENETSQENVVHAYFKEESYPMEIAEMRIAALISDYNNEKQELTDLMNKY